MNQYRSYIAIDLKSFYASVECVERGLDPLTTKLVVADESRTDKTICLAVSPALKAYGISGRARLFEVLQKVKREDFICATPRMQLYLDYSQRIYNIYLKYIAPEDIHIYSIDEVFIDVTPYLCTYNQTAHQLAITIIRDVLSQTGITATAGIGTNLYLCKIAMDIVAKHADADADGVRIAELDEMSYRRLLWNHRPLTDFWRIGHRIAEKLNRYGMYTMGDVARQSIKDDELLYSLFGVNAELIIDHAWGWESCTMDMIKKYHPTTHSLSSGQVLSCPYDAKKAKIVVREMAESLALQLVSRKLKTDQIVLSIGYDRESLTTLREYNGEITQDHYGRMVPKRAHGSQNLMRFSSSSKLIVETTMQLYNRIIDFNLLIRRINITANHVITEEESIKKEKQPKQLHLFEEENSNSNDNSEFAQNREKEHRIQEVMLHIKQEFGNNAILKGINFANGATARERNQQIGGHKA